ncbi:glycerol-3-phosphate dehydrogenase/oxidase [Curvibacter sp. CHRR-16]|uniref:glycerol-3-phosphate dehydrogenase/oxidase n=1 Tax=Curvibacter sp. CHRR-16 TaxID=2835872 RepID=UPI001BD9F78B|nr:glycerol-3-phosphate dehydrogenase/oxidase [Curvibacter sp. CHRR-16]MBT0570006.1 glycerol-3-phosphate dehydrogenase/oxidase [Curvibacter sp. CHRR-16]
MTTNPASPLPTDRGALLQKLQSTTECDVLVVGGGATGLGVALDAASRGHKVVLLEAHDFAKGTSSRATKLVHGGVRYLAQGNISLVYEALHERSTLLRNAPHLAQPLPFVVPVYRRWDQLFYGAGLALYDLLAGKAGLGRTRLLSKAQTLLAIPGVKQQGLCGGVQYWDGQFDDARLALALARTAAREGALALNYCRVDSLEYEAGRVSGVRWVDALGGASGAIRARCVINATGVWVDALRTPDGAHGNRATEPLVTPSQGVHLVVDRGFLLGDKALMVPKTSDGRVLFAVPWLGKVILGTTDTQRSNMPLEPQAFEEEIDFILRESANYLQRRPLRSDVRSVWVGLRPLVKPQSSGYGGTKSISREHTVDVSQTGLVTVTGGKWTTYRAMAEDVLAKCASAGLLSDCGAGRTAQLPLVGAQMGGRLTQEQGLHIYGSERISVDALPGGDTYLVDGLTEAMVRFAVRYEYARTVEDVLARRSRLLFLDARKAMQVAESVAAILRSEGVADPFLQEFNELAKGYGFFQESC